MAFECQKVESCLPACVTMDITMDAPTSPKAAGVFPEAISNLSKISIFQMVKVGKFHYPCLSPVMKIGAMRRLLLVMSVLLMAGTGRRAKSAPASESLFENQTPETFRQLPQAWKKINFEKIDFDLLSAAVFHATNRRRAMESRARLRHHPRVREVAQMQAKIMADRGSISHINPEVPDKKTPLDRFRLVGLNPAYLAENVATAFGLNYQTGVRAYIRVESGRKVLSRAPGGKALEMQTYVGFAETLVDSWMASPAHRKNILSANPGYLGVGCQRRARQTGMPMFYCAQEFFTPQAVHP